MAGSASFDCYCGRSLSVGMQSSEERAQRAAQQAAAAEAAGDAKCRSLGAQPGTPAYVDCRLRVEQMASAEAASAAASRAAAGAQLQRAGMAMMMGPPTVNCTSTPFGNSVQTRCQ
jgi:hypothetical protein